MRSDKVLDDFFRYGLRLFIEYQYRFSFFYRAEGVYCFFVFLIKIFKRNNTVVGFRVLPVDQDILLFIWLIPLIRIEEKNIFILYAGHQNIMLFLKIQTHHSDSTVVQRMVDTTFFTYVYTPS